MFDKLLLVVSHNIGFWVLILSSIVFGIIMKIFFNKKIVIWEAIIQIGVSCLVIFAAYMICFQTTSGMGDFCVFNGYVQSAEYYEEWTEKVETTRYCTDSKGNSYACGTDVSYVNHPPYWQVNLSTNESVHISQAQYRYYVSNFKGETKKTLWHSGQSSFGDGNMYYVNYKGNPTTDYLTVFPSATEHSVVNYLKGSKSIKRRTGNTKGYEKWLRDYPRVFNGSKTGTIEINRVVLGQAEAQNLPFEWIDVVDRKLDFALATLGAQKQVNILVYVTNTLDQKFLYALEEHWINAKKNDVVVILGVKDYPKLDWVGVLAWSKNKDFNVALQSKLRELPDLSNAALVAETIVNQVKLPANAGGFQRQKMSDLEYLISDITLPVWVQILIALIGIGVNVGLSTYFVKNEISNGSYDYRRRF